MHALVIEDDPGISSVVRRGLEAAGWTVVTRADGRKGLECALEEEFHLLILDLMLPGMDGFRICEELRLRRRKIPILMLTARDTVQDKVKGLDLGADDYLPKPFDFDELMARIRALMRRDRVHRSRIIHVDNLEIDTTQRRVTRGGADMGLSRREYDLLEALATREGRVLTREIIQEIVWNGEPAYSNNVDAYIKMLRKKIDADFEVKLIHTIRGVGYVMRSPET
jgi:two-component system copper resistance phosphate regulon response regulator CusR